MVVVVSDAEAFFDQITDHRPGPDSAGVARLLWPGLNELNQLAPLLVGQFPLPSWWHAG